MPFLPFCFEIRRDVEAGKGTDTDAEPKFNAELGGGQLFACGARSPFDSDKMIRPPMVIPDGVRWVAFTVPNRTGR